jgi:hypothetical protein
MLEAANFPESGSKLRIRIGLGLGFKVTELCNRP